MGAFLLAHRTDPVKLQDFQTALIAPSAMPLFTFTHLEKIVPDAYHGTLARNVESILSEGFRPTRDIEAHLGNGVYFYESSVAWAEYWGRQKARQAGRGVEIAVMSAQIKLGRCIDLSAREHQLILSSFATEIENRIKSGTMAGEFQRITSAFIYNLAAQRSNADTIRKPYGPAERKGPKLGWSGVDLTMRLVICVRQLANISNITLVKTLR